MQLVRAGKGGELSVHDRGVVAVENKGREGEGGVDMVYEGRGRRLQSSFVFEDETFEA